MTHHKAIAAIAHETIGRDTETEEWERWATARYFVHTSLMAPDVPATVRAYMLAPIKGQGLVHYSTRGI